MKINTILPPFNDIIKDEDQLWYFTREQKNTIIDYLQSCSLEDLKDTSEMGERYLVPTWYYLLNDYDIAKNLIEKDLFNQLIGLNKSDYKIKENAIVEENLYFFSSSREVVTHLSTTLYFTPNNEVLLLLKQSGFSFKDNTFMIDNLYRTYEIIKSGVIDFNEDFLIDEPYAIEKQDSILQKILWNYNSKKESSKNLLEMAKTINGFVELGCKTDIQYKTLASASEVFVSEKNHYRELIKKYCPDLNIFMEKLDFIERMQNLPARQERKIKI